jgi:gas vesicle protein
MLQRTIRPAPGLMDTPATRSSPGKRDAPTAPVCRDGQGGDSYRTEETVTILERIRPGRRPIEFGQIAKDLMNRNRISLDRDPASVLDQLKDAAVDAIDAFQELASDAAERAGGAVGDAVDSFAGDASKATRGVAKDVTKAASNLQLDKQVDRGLDKVDGRVDDLVDRIRQALPTERITTLVANLERELPTTDGDRYDRAFRRGFARARTSFVVIGAATGIAAGIAGAFLLDPERGPERRRAIQARVRRTTSDVTRQVQRTATMTADRAKGFAYERGILTSGDGSGSASRPSASEPPALVPVMDPSATAPEPVMPLADGPVTDPASIEREPLGNEAGLVGGVSEATEERSPAEAMTADDVRVEGQSPEDDRLSVNSSAVTSTLEPQAEDATITGDESDRGTWHRTM